MGKPASPTDVLSAVAARDFYEASLACALFKAALPKVLCAGDQQLSVLARRANRSA